MRPILIVFIICLYAACGSAQDRIEIRDLDVSAYPAFVFSMQLWDGSTPVYPVDAARVVLREDGRSLAVSIDCPALRPQRPSIAIGFERSLDGNFPPAVIAAREFVAAIQFADHDAEASFWSFATTVDHDVDMTRDSAALQRAVDDLSAAQWPFNGTALYECMHNAVEDVVRAGSGSTRAVVFVTDGFNNSSWFGRTLEQVEGRAAVDNVRIYVLLLRNRVAGEDAMRALTATTGGFMLQHDAPGAVDSVYADIVRPDASALWCTLRATGRSCADGSARRLDIGYVRAEGDTLWQRRDVTLPYRPDDLQPLHVWFSPSATWAGDSAMTVAMGVELRDGLQPPPFTLALPLNGLQLRNVEIVEWNGSWQQSGDTLYLQSRPPAAGLQDGHYLLARLRLSMSPASSLPFVAVLTASADGCLRLAEGAYPASAALALDSTLIERDAVAALRLRVTRVDVPEGLQRIDATLAVNPAHASFLPPFDRQHLLLSPGWIVERSDMLDSPQEQQLRLRLRGDADAAYSPITVSLRATANAPYRIPVRLRAPAEINGRDARETQAGLLVVRDSCFNNVVLQTDVILSAPFPQPTKGSVSLQALSPRSMRLGLRVLDALGRARMQRSVDIQPGSSVLTLDVSSLPSGRYTLECSGDARNIVFPLLVLP